MQQIAEWLEKRGLGQYAQRFAENDIDPSVLRDLTDHDLEKIGVSLGHRRKILRAIRELTAASPAAPPPATASKPAPHDSAERRQLTVMFTDLVGSTSLSTRLDPEDLQDIIGAYHRCCAKFITQSGGFVARYLGDGVLAYFGYPQAHEDDAERAVRAGLALVEAVAKLDAGQAMSLHVRVGIATGLVVVGDFIAGGPGHEHEVVGETPNLAARLQTLAEPDAVVISGETRRMLGGLFEFRDLGAVSVKGFGSPLQVWQVTGASTVDSRFEALRAITTPLVGREEEIDLLMRRWRQAKRGHGSVVLISGEPGIGKSRLTVALQERLQAASHTRLRHSCSPHHQDSALYPIISQLQRAAEFRRDDTDQQRLDKLEAVLAQSTNDFRDAVPLIADLLSVSCGDRYPPLDLTPQKRKQKTLRALLAQLEGVTARQPVLAVFEDVHWIDPTSLELLDLIVDRVPTLPVLLIITFRSEFAPPWTGRTHLTLLTLKRLPPRQRAEMIRGVTGGKALPKDIADQIIDCTDGVPLFIEELTKTVVESGILVEAGDRYAWTGPVTPLAIPTTLQASLLARLDRLPATREAAQIGAALGRSFSHELIGAVAQMPQKQLDDALAQLVSAGLILRRGSAPDAEYTFKHALVQEAAHGTLLRNRRQQIHARIAATLENRFAEIVTTQPALLAQHCAEAGLDEKAVEHWLAAGQQALARSAMVEAATQLQKGLVALERLPDAPRHMQQELDLRMALGTALIATRPSASNVGENYGRARALAAQLDRVDRLIPVLRGQWIFHYGRGEHKLALSIAEQMETIGEERDDPTILSIGHLCHGGTCFNLGEFIAARALFENYGKLNDAAPRQTYTARTSVNDRTPRRHLLGASRLDIVQRASAAVNLAHLGYVDQARAIANETLSIARRRGHAYSLGFALVGVIWVEGIIDSPLDARRHAKEVVALSNEHGFPAWLALGLVYHGWSLAALGQLPEGLALMSKGLSVYRSFGLLGGKPSALRMVAETYLKAARLDESMKFVAEAFQIISDTDERRSEAELHRLQGDLLNAAGNQAAAAQSYHQALAVAKRQSARLFELQAATNLARLWRDHGKREQAHALLAPIYRWFTEGFDTPVLGEASALLEQFGSPNRYSA